MGIPVLKFATDKTKKPSQIMVDPESDGTLADLKSSGEFGAYIVREQDLETLITFKDVIQVGTKGEKLELARPMLGMEGDGVPLMRGTYSSAGRLVQGIEALLGQASEKGDRNIYVISTKGEIFEILVTHVSSETVEDEKVDLGSSDATVAIRIMINLLKSINVPAELEQAYLGVSPEARLVRQMIVLAAKNDFPVLIIGETGTGKEIVAREIHKYSLEHRGAKRSRRFSTVNCAADHGKRFESELFGHVKGAFPGAIKDKAGIWEATGRGTLFLDEIGELRSDHQVKILQVLEAKKLRRIGETDERRHALARVLTATNRDLFSMVGANQFKADLYHRLNGFLIQTPALRNHPEDIPVLAQHLWKKKTGDAKSKLPDAILSQLLLYGWPGNVRELRAVLEKMYWLFGKKNLGVVHIRAALQFQGQAGGGAQPPGEAPALSWVERLRLIQRLDEDLRACEMIARPIVDGGRLGIDEIHYFWVSLHYRLRELESLHEKESLLSEGTFAVLSGLKDRLFDFEGLFQSDVKGAVRYWKDEVAKELKRARSALFQEGDGLLRNV